MMTPGKIPCQQSLHLKSKLEYEAGTERSSERYDSARPLSLCMAFYNNGIFL